MEASPTTLIIGALASVMVALLVLPLLALVLRAIDTAQGNIALDIGPVIEALLLSLGTTSVSVLLIILFGTPLAYTFARYEFPFKRLLAIFVEMPIVMPPVVAGLALLSAFGRRGLIGSLLADIGITITFTAFAVILAQIFIAAPFYIRAAQTRFGALPREIEEAARIDGANDWHVFWFITIPLSTKALITGLVLSWARALGEFGATILFAGNLQGRTQTMPLLVYGALERDLNATFISALILLVMAGCALAAMRWITRLDDRQNDPLADL